MNWNRMESDWSQVKDKVREEWGQLSDVHLEQIAGKRGQLVGGIQKSYGIARSEAERQVIAWEMRNAFLDTGHSGSSRAQAKPRYQP